MESNPRAAPIKPNSAESFPELGTTDALRCPSPPIGAAGPCPQSSGTDPSISGRPLREAWNLGENRRWPEMDGKKGVKQHGRFEGDFLIRGRG